DNVGVSCVGHHLDDVAVHQVVLGKVVAVDPRVPGSHCCLERSCQLEGDGVQASAARSRSRPSCSTSALVAKFNRANPAPPAPKSEPSLSPILALAANSFAGSSPSPVRRRSSQAR